MVIGTVGIGDAIGIVAGLFTDSAFAVGERVLVPEELDTAVVGLDIDDMTLGLGVGLLVGTIVAGIVDTGVGGMVVGTDGIEVVVVVAGFFINSAFAACERILLPEELDTAVDTLDFDVMDLGMGVGPLVATIVAGKIDTLVDGMVVGTVCIAVDGVCVETTAHGMEVATRLVGIIGNLSSAEGKASDIPVKLRALATISLVNVGWRF